MGQNSVFCLDQNWRNNYWVFHWMTRQSWWYTSFCCWHIMILYSASTGLIQPIIATLDRTMACSQKAAGNWSQCRPRWRLWSIAGRRRWSMHRCAMSSFLVSSINPKLLRYVIISWYHIFVEIFTCMPAEMAMIQWQYNGTTIRGWHQGTVKVVETAGVHTGVHLVQSQYTNQ